MKSGGPTGWVNPRSRLLEPPGKPISHDGPGKEENPSYWRTRARRPWQPQCSTPGGQHLISQRKLSKEWGKLPATISVVAHVDLHPPD